jgi:CubicO group peptidase (beta-lactamase class C family)
MNTRMRTLLAASAFLLFTVALDGQATRDAERPGFSPERLARIDKWLQQYVDENRLAGVVALVLRDGNPVYERAVGWSDKEAGRRMTTDTIFRIASQSKAITSAAILALVEEGKISVNDPVSRFIPTYAKTTVSVPKDGGGADIVPARRAITIRDLLTHTAGISYGRDAHVAALYQEKGLGPAEAMAGIPPTRPSPSATRWSAWARCRSSRSLARPGSTDTTPTFSGASSNALRASGSTSSFERASPVRCG